MSCSLDNERLIFKTCNSYLCPKIKFKSLKMLCRFCVCVCVFFLNLITYLHQKPSYQLSVLFVFIVIVFFKIYLYIMYEDVHNQLIRKIFYLDNIIWLDLNTMYTYYKYNTQIHFYILFSDLCRSYTKINIL